MTFFTDDNTETQKNLSYLPKVSWLVNEEPGLNPALLDLKVHSLTSIIPSLLDLLPAKGLYHTYLDQWFSAL